MSKIRALEMNIRVLVGDQHIVENFIVCALTDMSLEELFSELPIGIAPGEDDNYVLLLYKSREDGRVPDLCISQNAEIEEAIPIDSESGFTLEQLSREYSCMQLILYINCVYHVYYEFEGITEDFFSEYRGVADFLPWIAKGATYKTNRAVNSNKQDRLWRLANWPSENPLEDNSPQIQSFLAWDNEKGIGEGAIYVK